MDQGVVKTILDTGLLGALLLASWAVIWVLYRSLDDARASHLKTIELLQSQRVADVHQHQSQVLEIARASVAAIASAATAQAAVKESVGDVRNALAEYNSTLRQYLDNVRGRDIRKSP